MEIKFETQYSYDDISLIPNKGLVSSRSKCSTDVKLGNHTFSSPIYPANMKSVVNENTCEYFASKGWFYTMHRFNNLGKTDKEIIDDYLNFIKNMHKKGYIASISLGVKDIDRSILAEFIKTEIYPDYITIDVAHGYSLQMQSMLSFIDIAEFKKKNGCFIVAGNVCTSEAVEALQSWGCDAIKIGLSQGSVCTTKNKTGVGRPMASTIIDCCAVSKIPIIADGGIKYHGDIIKALALGADLVMAGKLFCGYDENPGEIIYIDNNKYKEYYGSASQYNKLEVRNIEGEKKYVNYKGSMDRLLEEIVEDIQSSISYAGGTDLSALRNFKIVKI